MGARAPAQLSINNVSETTVETSPGQEGRPPIDLISSCLGQPLFRFEDFPKKAEKAITFVVYW